jgi:uncharacterized protein YjiS (DUF1127 family)
VSNPATIRSNAIPRAWRDFHLPALRHMARAFGKWRAVRRAERELYALDDRMLKDIGIARSEIHSVVRDRQSGPRPLLPF